MNKKNVLSVKNLNKIYNSKDSNSINALNNLNLDVKEGEIFGLLGPNGAGKTTFINILAGTVIKTSGIVNVWGFNLDRNPRQVRASIGIVPQEVVLDPFFSPKKLLELQREIAKNGEIVMVGRDIGTVILPDADLKIFLMASSKERAFRRYQEFNQLGIDLKIKDIEEMINKRDQNDRERIYAPLKKDSSAYLLETDNLSLENVCKKIITLFHELS